MSFQLLFGLVEGLAHQYTLILPSHIEADTDFFEVGELTRIEAAELIVGYSFDLQTNEILPKKVPNLDAGTRHTFRAWRLKGSPTTLVKIRELQSDAILDAIEAESSE